MAIARRVAAGARGPRPEAPVPDAGGEPPDHPPRRGHIPDVTARARLSLPGAFAPGCGPVQPRHCLGRFSEGVSPERAGRHVPQTGPSGCARPGWGGGGPDRRPMIRRCPPLLGRVPGRGSRAPARGLVQARHRPAAGRCGPSTHARVGSGRLRRARLPVIPPRTMAAISGHPWCDVIRRRPASEPPGQRGARRGLLAIVAPPGRAL